MQIDKLRKLSIYEFKEIVDASLSLSQVCIKIGLHDGGSHLKQVKELIAKQKIDIAHFHRRRKYTRIKRTCLGCDVVFEVPDGGKGNKKVTCSKSCSNKVFPKRKKQKNNNGCKCENCGALLFNPNRRFCNRQCFGKLQRKNTFRRIENGTYRCGNKGNSKNKALKLYLIDKYGHKCSVCSNSEWLNKPIPIQLDHRDGDSENDKEYNIRLICPNCHAQTPNYCRKNKNSKRKHRMIDYRNGKKKW